MYILREGGRKERNRVRANVLDWEYVTFANERAVQKSSNRRHLLNKDQQDVFFLLIYINNLCQIDYLWTLIMLVASQCRCMINTICCIYSKIPPDDEQLIYSKHVQEY
jgi:hypothetical protein